MRKAAFAECTNLGPNGNVVAKVHYFKTNLQVLLLATPEKFAMIRLFPKINQPKNSTMNTSFAFKTAVLFGAALAILNPPAQAQSLLNVKIGQTSQNGSADGAYQETAAAVLGSANGYWNEYAFVSSTPSLVSVVDSTGAALAGVSLTVQNTSGVGGLSTSGNPAFLMNKMPYQNPGSSDVFNISLSGLLASTEYQFVGYAAYPGLTLGAAWTVTTGTFVSGTTSNTGTSADITSGVGVAYSQFFVMTDSSGNLAIRDASLTSSYPVLSGFQLEPVPEPGTWTMLLGGGATLLAFRRARHA